MRTILTTMAILAAAGCASLMDVDGRDPGGEMDAEFQASVVQPGTGAAPPHEATGAAGTVSIRGSLSTPVPCYQVAGRVTREGRDLTLRVHATPIDVMCIQVIATWGYRAEIAGLEPGEYRVRVVHDGAAGTRGDTVVLERTVAVR